MPSLEDVKLKFKVESDSEKATKETISAIDKVANHANLKKAEITRAVTAAGKSVVALGVVAAGALTVSAKAAINFESSFAGVKKTVEATDEEFAKLAQNFRDLAKTKPVDVNELNKIAELAGQLGVSGVDDLTKFTATIADIAVTTNLTTESAATDFARIANIMGLPLDKVDRMASSVVGLGNNFATTERDIVNFASRIAGAGKIVGFSTSDIFGMSAAISSVGINAEAGGTAVQKMALQMNEAVTQGTDDLELFAITAGLSVDEFTKLWKEDAAGAFTNFVEGLGVAGDDATKILSELGLEDQRLMRTFLSLANAGDLLRDGINQSSEDWIENMAITEEARKRYETMESRMILVKNQIADMAITLGNVLLPKLSELFEKLAPVISKIADWIEQNPELTAKLLLVAATIGGVTASLFVLVPAITNIIILFKAFKAITILLNAKSLTFIATLGKMALTLFSSVIPAIQGVFVAMGPVGWFLLILTAAVALFAVAWSKNMFNIRGVTEKVFNFVIGKFNALIDQVNALLELISGIPGIDIDFRVGKLNAVSFDKTVGGGDIVPAMSVPNMSVAPNMNYLPGYGPAAMTPAPQQSSVQNFNVNNNIYGDVDTEAMIRDLAFSVNTE